MSREVVAELGAVSEDRDLPSAAAGINVGHTIAEQARHMLLVAPQRSRLNTGGGGAT
jgi:hypothetical protein